MGLNGPANNPKICFYCRWYLADSLGEALTVSDPHIVEVMLHGRCKGKFLSSHSWRGPPSRWGRQNRGSKPFLSSVSQTPKTGVQCLTTPGIKTPFDMRSLVSPVTSLVTHHPADDCIWYYIINHMGWINSLMVLPSLYSETFSFMLTGEDGSRRFGYCRRLLVSCCRTPHPLLPPCWAQLVPTDMWYIWKSVRATHETSISRIKWNYNVALLRREPQHMWLRL